MSTAQTAGAAVWKPPRWASVSTLLLSVLGIGVAIYLTYAHYTDPKVLACSDSGTINCAKVTTSAQSRFLGMPVAVLGLAYFVGMFVLSLPWLWRRPEPAVRWLRLAAVTGGIAFVLWLVYAELFIIDAICLWCTVVHALTFLMFVVVAFASLSGSAGVDPLVDYDVDEYGDEYGDEFDDEDGEQFDDGRGTGSQTGHEAGTGAPGPR